MVVVIIKILNVQITRFNCTFWFGQQLLVALLGLVHTVVLNRQNGEPPQAAWAVLLACFSYVGHKITCGSSRATDFQVETEIDHGRAQDVVSSLSKYATIPMLRNTWHG